MLVILVVICVINLIVLSSIYSYSIIKHRIFPHNYADEQYKPDCAIFLPCKEHYKTLKKNLESICRQDYSGYYYIYFILENKNDKAYPVVKKIADSYEHCELIFADKAKNNGQKNFNILKALDKIEHDKKKYDVYTFFDSDHEAPKEWLTSLVKTLTINNTEIATTRGVLEPDSILPIGNVLYTMLNNYMFSVNTFSNQAWGGSIAIRVETFEKYKIKEIWKNSLSHDCPINGLNARILYNPKYYPKETDYYYDINSFIRWIKRQFTNWRLFSIKLWYLSFFGILSNFICLPFFLFIVSKSVISHQYYDFSFVLLLYIIVSYLVFALFLSYPMKNKFFWTTVYFLLIPLLLTILLVGFIMSIFNKQIDWAGKKYIIGQDGIVLKIEEH